MKRLIYKTILLFVVLLFSISGKATHLVGGEMSYECIGSGRYQITMNIFRDDFYANPNATLDDPATITIFNNDNNSVFNTNYNISLTSSFIIPTTSDPCIKNIPNDVRIEQGVYQFVVNLPNNTRGYTIVYQRCCRNNTILNLQSGQGSTIAINIPPNSICNSSPVFKNNPPLFLCANSKLEFDMSATDINGNRIKYSICAPLQGLDQTTPTVQSPSSATSPPFDSVFYRNTYSSQLPLGPTSTIYINSVTGLLTAVPKTLGQFVVGICAQEIATNGTILSTSIRDFQFNVEDCQISSATPIVVTDNSPTSAVKVDDTTYSNCQGNTVSFGNEVVQSGTTYFWDFGVRNRTDDTSILANPTFAYPDTGIYYVTQIVNKGKPCSDTSRIRVIYYPGLQVNFNYTPTCQNYQAQFSDASTSIYNDINKWTWVFPVKDTVYGKNQTKIFSTPGNYTVELYASTVKGCLGKTRKTITVDPRPKAAFTSANLCYKRGTLFTDGSTLSSGTIKNYFWDFGDGFTDTLKNPIHIYQTFKDTFIVKHVVVSAIGCSDTIINKIKMDDTVKLSYTTSPTNLCEKLPVTFTNTSTGGNPTAFQWIINNGTPINGNTAIATFNSAGTFPVLLISTNRCGKDTLRSSITIQSNPTINLGTDVTVCNKSTKQLTAIGAYDSLRWNTNENTNTITLDGNRSPINISVYKNGCIGKDTVLVKKQTITPKFTDNFICLNKPITFNNTSTINFGSIVQYDWNFGDGNTATNTQNPTNTFTPFNNYTVQLFATSDIGCKDTFKLLLKMDTILNVNFNSSEAITCQRNQVTFINQTTGGVNNQYTWSTNGNVLTTKDLNYTYLGTGNYPVKLVVKNRCYSDSISKTYTIRPRPDVYIGRDTVLCKNQQTIYSINPSPYDSIRWINGSNANSIIANGIINPIKIKVYLDGCKAEDTVNVIAQKFNLNFSNDFICFNRAVLFNNNSTINYGTITNYNWNFGDNETSIIKSPTHTYTVFGPKIVRLIARSSNTCFDTIEKTVGMDDTIAFNINPIPSDICIGKSEKYTNQSIGGFNTNYTWTLNNLNPQTATIAEYSFNTIGQQVLKLTVNHRCGTDSIKYPFNVKGLPKITLDDSLITCPDQLISITATGDFDSVFWNNGSTSNPTETDGNTSPLIFTGYKLGCFSKDSIKIIQNCEVFIPSAFSPNNDGINDTYNFIPQNILSFNLKIFNRWGELIFETTDLNNSWDGYYKGEKCETDNYVYYATGIKKDKKQFTIKGIVTLLK